MAGEPPGPPPVPHADYRLRDRAIWQGIFDTMPDAWFEAAASDAMGQCRDYFAAGPCQQLLDVGCGFGRWARFLAGLGVSRVVGIDYAEPGIRKAHAWAQRDGFEARFAVASSMALPFRDGCFDGVLAALLLDNLSREDAAAAVAELTRVARPGARGFFLFNPRFTAGELAALPDDNPTRACMHVVYGDAELRTLLAGWRVTREGTTAERFRVVEALVAPAPAGHSS